MAFLRVKRIKGREYLYLVKSRWDPERKRSRQETLKYLGAAADATLEDVPPEYRDEKVEAFFLRTSAQQEERRAQIAHGLQGRLLPPLLAGDVGASLGIAREGLRPLGLDALHVHVLSPAMHAIGEMWARGEIYVTQEHVATNTMTQVVEALNAEIRWTGPKRGTAVVCTPDGERHHLVARVLEGLLKNRGFRVLDITASAPPEDIVHYLAAERPDLVLVSLTLEAHLPALRRLLEAVRTELPDLRVLVGGQAVYELPAEDLPSGVDIVRSNTLETLDGVARGGGG